MARIERALVIRAPHIDRILAGRKTWEIRSSRTEVRGLIGLIEAGSGLIVGACELVDVVGPLSPAEWRQNARRIGASPETIAPIPHANTYAWVLRGARRFAKPRPYTHPSGAVRWVKASLRG